MTLARMYVAITLIGFLAALLLTVGCDSGGKAVKTAGRVADDISRLANAEPSPPGENVAPADPLPSDVQAVVATLNELPVSERGSEIDYDRDDWRHWVDADRDCQNTRAEVLIAESVARVSFTPNADGEECRVTGGEWRGPWSGEVFTDAGDVDIDHHVPLGHAHESGGWNWYKERKRAYANDLAHAPSLQATSASVNRAKGKQPPDEWRPDHTAGWCRYAADWVSVKAKWGLTVSKAEVEVLREMLDTCDDDGSWGLTGMRPQ